MPVLDVELGLFLLFFNQHLQQHLD